MFNFFYFPTLKGLLMETSVNRSILVGLREMFSTIKKRALEALQEYNKLLNNNPTAFLDYNSLDITLRAVVEPRLNNLLKQIEGIVDSYNEAVSKFKNATRGTPEYEQLEQMYPINLQENASRYLERVIANCGFVIGVIDGILISSQVTPEELDQLKRTRKKVESFYECHPALAEHLKEAIAEIEMGHDLAAALIAGKCFVSIEDKLIEHFKIPKDKKEKQREQLIKKISKELGLSKEDVERLHKATRYARNYFTHNLKSRPTHETALSLVLDTVTFAEYFCKILKKD